MPDRLHGPEEGWQGPDDLPQKVCYLTQRNKVLAVQCLTVPGCLRSLQYHILAFKSADSPAGCFWKGLLHLQLQGFTMSKILCGNDSAAESSYSYDLSAEVAVAALLGEG